MINAFLYSVYGQAGGERHKDHQAIIGHRHRWLDALLADREVEAVVAFGRLAREAYEHWQRTPQRQRADLVFEPLTHPTMPEASSQGNPTKKAEATKRMLAQWNRALERLHTGLGQRDTDGELTLYGEELLTEDSSPIPDFDLPASVPPWMRSVKQWAARKGETDEHKRATIVGTVPKDERPWR